MLEHGCSPAVVSECRPWKETNLCFHFFCGTRRVIGLCVGVLFSILVISGPRNNSWPRYHRCWLGSAAAKTKTPRGPRRGRDPATGPVPVWRQPAVTQRVLCTVRPHRPHRKRGENTVCCRGSMAARLIPRDAARERAKQRRAHSYLGPAAAKEKGSQKSSAAARSPVAVEAPFEAPVDVPVEAGSGRRAPSTRPAARGGGA